MSSAAAPPPPPGSRLAHGSRTPAEHADWLRLHREAQARGGFLGHDWGDDAYVAGVLRRFVLPHLDPDRRVLEIGPGGGRYTERLVPLVRALDAIDVSPEILEDLAKRLGHPASLRTFAGDGRTLAALTPGEYELVFSFNLFLFLDLAGVCSYLSELRTRLSPTGLAVLQYADYSSRGGKAYLEEHLAEWSLHPRSFGRFTFFTKGFMAEILRDRGFEVVFNASHGRDAFVGFSRADGPGLEHHRAVAETVARSRRWYVAPREVDEDEAVWWSWYAELEEELCWVQPSRVRRLLRRHYVREIVTSVPEGGTVLDYGCGTGWLSELLAECGAHRVVGVDDCEAQIARASLHREDSPHAGAIEYLLGEGVPDGFQADVVVVHAVLHHLAWLEIARARNRLRDVVKPGGTLWLLEPVVADRPDAAAGARLGAGFADALASSWRMRRRMSEEERRLRARLQESRAWPRRPGHGPSPKEMPFREGEIEACFGREFRLVSARPVLHQAHLVAAQVLLLSQTHRWIGAVLRSTLLPLVSAWERASLGLRPRESRKGWVFHLYRFERR